MSTSRVMSLSITCSSVFPSHYVNTNQSLAGYQRNSCGYCKSDNGSLSFPRPSFSGERLPDTSFLGASYYTSSVAVRPEHYEELIDRGWRRYDRRYTSARICLTFFPVYRSGTLYYKQNLQRSCCPYYTLRLEAAAYQPRRDQRKAINRWNKFILGPEYMRKAARLCPRSRE